MTTGDGGEPTPARRAPRVRPYTITGGRTRTQVPLAVETLVQTASDGDIAHLRREQQDICLLCREPMSVAEVSAHTALPLGVVRVLLDDMAGEGLVVLHVPPSDRPDRALMERVLDGLQRL